MSLLVSRAQQQIESFLFESSLLLVCKLSDFRNNKSTDDNSNQQLWAGASLISLLFVTAILCILKSALNIEHQEESAQVGGKVGDRIYPLS